MLDIKIYGTGTSGHEYLRHKLKGILDEAKIVYSINSITDVGIFIDKKINSIPAIQINDGDVWELNQNQDYHTKTRDLIQSILKSKNYGQMKKILFATDFSSSSDNAFGLAFGLAKKIGAYINVLHTYHPQGETVDGGSFIVEKEIESRKEQLHKFVVTNNQDQLGAILESPLLEEQLIMGFAADILTTESKNYDLLIMGAKGTGKIEKRLFGSVSLQLAKQSNCPVIIVPEKSDNQPIKKILFGYSDKKINQVVFPKLISFAKLIGASISVLNVTQDPEVNKKLILEDFQKEFDISDLEVSFHTVYGKYPEKELTNFAHENEIDMVCLAKQNKGFWHDLFIMSTTKELTIASDKPLLILHV